MISTTLTDLRRELKAYVDQVVDEGEIIVVNRGRRKGVVVMSLDQFNMLDATQWLTASAANTSRLRDAVRQADSQNYQSHELIEP
ncbi:MAG: type II toxin-antitoxin system prevent-host-death family antitoxin [Cryomorphaceae bacterium]|jgi:antitoxin YefM|nr:type II toxin-antitoxin system prevent-host-death family antitoxin [Cryomorphaceae bacterium]